MVLLPRWERGYCQLVYCQWELMKTLIWSQWVCRSVFLYVTDRKKKERQRICEKRDYSQKEKDRWLRCRKSKKNIGRVWVCVRERDRNSQKHSIETLSCANTFLCKNNIWCELLHTFHVPCCPGRLWTEFKTQERQQLHFHYHLLVYNYPYFSLIQRFHYHRRNIEGGVFLGHAGHSHCTPRINSPGSPAHSNPLISTQHGTSCQNTAG